MPIDSEERLEGCVDRIFNVVSLYTVKPVNVDASKYNTYIGIFLTMSYDPKCGSSYKQTWKSRPLDNKDTYTYRIASLCHRQKDLWD